MREGVAAMYCLASSEGQHTFNTSSGFAEVGIDMVEKARVLVLLYSFAAILFIDSERRYASEPFLLAEAASEKDLCSKSCLKKTVGQVYLKKTCKPSLAVR